MNVDTRHHTISGGVADPNLINAPLPVFRSLLLVCNGDNTNPGIIQIVDQSIGKSVQQHFPAGIADRHPEIRKLYE